MVCSCKSEMSSWDQLKGNVGSVKEGSWRALPSQWLPHRSESSTLASGPRLPAGSAATRGALSATVCLSRWGAGGFSPCPWPRHMISTSIHRTAGTKHVLCDPEKGASPLWTPGSHQNRHNNASLTGLWEGSGTGRAWGLAATRSSTSSSPSPNIYRANLCKERAFMPV